MIALICTFEPYRIAWLPQFVNHYRQLGVDRFLLALQLQPSAPQETKDRDFASFKETLAALGVDDAFPWEHEFQAPAMYRHHLALKDEYLRDRDWIVWCDSDEFQEYPVALPEVIRQCEALGVNHVRGAFIDRVAADYTLPPFDSQKTLGETFPITCNVTAAIVRGEIRKVALARFPVRLAGGKHAPVADQPLKTITGWVQVHHFKWDAMLLERLRYRLRPECEGNFFWSEESRRLLAYFDANNSRFNPADLTPIALNGSHFISLAG